MRAQNQQHKDMQQPKPQLPDGEKSDEQPPDSNAGNKRHISKAEKKRRKKERLAADKSQQTQELQTGPVGQTEMSGQQQQKQQ